MATIVKMPAARARGPREGAESATILFFTGVRYVRDEDPGMELALPDPARVDASIGVKDSAAMALN